ncbi:MAG TPA: hypothetical protein PKD85_02385, partial [Saprospiraceae bacterium]|nr:hypothetical protein [Saprospiraceae bacterium]
LSLATGPIFGQLVPKFDKTSGDTVALFNNLPVIINLKLGVSDPTLISVKSTEISSYMIAKFDDSTYVVNLNRPINEAKIKLYYKNLPVDIMTGVMAPITLPKVLIEGEESAISKGKINTLSNVVCYIEDEYIKKYRVQLHSFNLNLVHLNNRTEVIPNFSHTIANNNLTRIRTSPPGTVVYLSNMKLRTIYNNVIEIKGDSNKFVLVD